MSDISNYGLPMGWDRSTLEEVAKVIRGITFPASAKSKRSEPGTVVCLRTSNVQRTLELGDVLYVAEGYVKRDEQWLQDGDTVISMANSYELVGKVALAVQPPPRTTIGGFISIIRPQLVEPRFMYYQLASGRVQEVLRKSASQTVNISNLSLRAIYPTSLLLAPLPEQHRIVEALESYFTRLDDAVATLERVQRNLKRYRALVLKAAVEGRLVPTEAELARAQGRSYEPASVLLERILAERRRRWEEAELMKMKAKGKTPKDDKWKAKYVEPVAPDTTDLPELPEGWSWVTLHQVTTSVRDGPHYSPRYSARGVPFISGGNVRPEGVDFDGAKKISSELHAELSKRVRPEQGDILYTKGGTTGIARVNTYAHEFSVWVHVAVLKLSRSIEPFYLQHALNSPWCYTQAQRYTHGVGNQDLGLTRMINITVPLPPLPEQHRIASEVDRLDSLAVETAQILQSTAERLPRLRQSVLKWAFEGRLLDQDPTDEPASVLLERIRADRAAARTTPTGASADGRSPARHRRKARSK